MFNVAYRPGGEETMSEDDIISLRDMTQEMRELWRRQRRQWLLAAGPGGCSLGGRAVKCPTVVRRRLRWSIVTPGRSANNAVAQSALRSV